MLDMNNHFRSTFLGLRPAERARLLGSVRAFVTNDAFVNAVSGLNINDSDHTNSQKRDNIFFVAAQLQAFNEVPGLAEQVRTWLRS
jgi:hypothetical protein